MSHLEVFKLAKFAGIGGCQGLGRGPPTWLDERAIGDGQEGLRGLGMKESKATDPCHRQETSAGHVSGALNLQGRSVIRSEAAFLPETETGEKKERHDITQFGVIEPQ